MSDKTLAFILTLFVALFVSSLVFALVLVHAYFPNDVTSSVQGNYTGMLPNDTYNDTYMLISNNSHLPYLYDPKLEVVYDYSESAYVKILPIDNKFIILECKNSTLRFNETSIWCER